MKSQIIESGTIEKSLKKFVKNQNFKIMKNAFYMLCNFIRRWYVVNFKMIWEELTSEMAKRWFSQIWPPVGHFECCIMWSYTRHALRVTAICHISFIMIPIAIQKLYRVNTNCVTDGRTVMMPTICSPEKFWGEHNKIATAYPSFINAISTKHNINTNTPLQKPLSCQQTLPLSDIKWSVSSKLTHVTIVTCVT